MEPRRRKGVIGDKLHTTFLDDTAVASATPRGQIQSYRLLILAGIVVQGTPTGSSAGGFYGSLVV